MSFPPPPQQPPPPPQQPQPVPKTTGLFAALFDVSFRHFATPHIARIVYILVMIVIAVGALGGLISAFGLMASRQPALGFFLLVLTPLAALLYLAIARMTIELFVAMTHTAEEITRLREDLTRR